MAINRKTLLILSEANFTYDDVFNEIKKKNLSARSFSVVVNEFLRRYFGGSCMILILSSSQFCTCCLIQIREKVDEVV